MKKLLKLTLWVAMVAVAIITIFFTDHRDLGYAIFIFAAPGGVGANFTFQLPYLPEVISWNDGGNPLNFLRIESQEDGVLHDWTAANITAMNGFLNVGALAANEYKMPVASGQIDGRHVTVSGQTSAIGAINFFVSSDNKGIVPYKTTLSNVLANSDTEFTAFAALFLPNLVTLNDRCQVFYNDGHVQIYDAQELADWSVMYQDTPGVIVNNVASNIKKVVVTSAAGGAAYLLKYKI